MSEELSKPYNPLDTENVGDSLVRAMLAAEPVRMDKLQPFPGAGVYAIYYVGDHPAYTQIAQANRDGQFGQAIYVGKAIPSGGRKGTVALGAVTGTYVYKRLREHHDSIVEAENLEVQDFYARWLIVEPIWIPLTETLMINRSACVWNAVVEGFGNHAPGKNRVTGKRTHWDTLHPGRVNRGQGENKWTAAQVQQEAITWVSQRL